jgi:hypothetical protein
MTTLFDVNEDALTVTADQASTGPLAGFFASFEASRQSQYKTGAQYGLEYALYEQDWKQYQALRDAGIPDPPILNRTDAALSDAFDYDLGGTYMDTARASRGGEVDPSNAKAIAEYDKRIAELQAARPDLHLYNSRQMFEVVAKNARDAEYADLSQKRTWGGTFGSFAGAVVGSVDPTTDPLNFATLGVGGVGKTALQRILMQSGSQGAIEALNQITGVQESRDLMGLSSGFGDAATRVAGAAIGGGALQAAGEGVAALGKRFFRGTPVDPAPPVESVVDVPSKPLALPPPDQLKAEAGAARIEANPGAYVDYLADTAPLSGIRVGKARTAADLIEMTDALDNWDAPPPAFIRPRTDAAAYAPGMEAPPRVDVARAVDSNARYQAARQQDPAVFDRYEKLLERKATFRRWIDELATGRNADVETTVSAIDTRIASLEARLRSTQGMKNKVSIKDQIKEARADKERVLKLSEQKETPDVAQVRRELAKADEQMRDLAPLLGRAHARAQGEWSPDTATLDAVWDAYKAGKADIDPPVKSALPSYDTAVALADKSPILKRAKPEQAGLTSADTATRVLADEAKIADEGLELFRETMKAVLGKEADGKLTVGEHTFDLDADRVHIEDADGNIREVSVREMLDENRETEYELEALQTCSMPRRSLPA